MINKKDSIKNNKFLYIAGIMLLIYGLGESIDCLFVALVSFGIILEPEITYFFSFQVLQDMWVTQPWSILCIFLSITSLRIASGIGILKNRLWGFWLGIFISGITLCIIVLFLPFGGLDGVITVPILIFLFIGYFGKKQILINQ